MDRIGDRVHLFFDAGSQAGKRVGEGAATTVVTAAEPPPERAGARVVEGTPDEAATELIAFLVERRVI